VPGGGASVIYADTVGDLGYAEELGNYAEYSGGPNTQETYLYARTLLEAATAQPGEGASPWLTDTLLLGLSCLVCCALSVGLPGLDDMVTLLARFAQLAVMQMAVGVHCWLAVAWPTSRTWPRRCRGSAG
jgi:hypothetical protein